MFIVRIEYTDESSETFMAKSFKTFRRPSGVVIELTLKDDTQKTVEVTGEAFIMNAETGRTVDRVRPRSKEVQERMSKVGA
jgi:hypothetical protein